MVVCEGAAGAAPARLRGTNGLTGLMMSWLQRFTGADGRQAWGEHARESILDMNNGIVTAAGIAEGFAAAGASTRTLLLAGAAVIFTGGLAAAGARYAEVRTEWEMDRSLLEAERASIDADPDAEFEELVGIYATKGLSADLARHVAEALTERDPVAAHADAELHLYSIASPRTSLHAALIAGVSYALGAVVPLAVVTAVPVGPRIELTFLGVLLALVLTGWFTSWLTGLPLLRLVRRNLVLGVATMAAGLVIGLAISVKSP
jgi:vacuolar iron transporter family protein